MKRIRPTSRALFAGLGLALLAGTLGLPVAQAAPATPARPAAPAAPMPLVASGPFSAQAGTELLTVTGVDLSDGEVGPIDEALIALLNEALGLPADLSVIDLGIAHTEAEADSDGPANGVATDRTYARAANIFPDDILSSIELGGLLSDVEASAPPSETQSANLLDLAPDGPLAPLVVADVSQGTATANWVSDTECVAADVPLSEGDLDTANAIVLPDFPAQEPGGLGGFFNSGEGVTSVNTVVDLPATGGPNDQRAIRATDTTSLAELNLLGDALRLAVETPAILTAEATGIPGGATFSYTPPQLVNLNDNTVIGPDELEALIEGALGPIFEAISPLITIVANVENATSGEGSPDGTTVDVAFSAVSVSVNFQGTQLLTLDLLPMRAAVTAPAGGIFCGGPEPENPLELGKQHSGPAIPGSTFDYTIHVGNISDNLGDPCTMNPVSVVDTLTGPAGTTIVSTEPAGATVTPIDGGFRIEWANVGPIEPGGRTTLRIRVGVPADAQAGQRYNDVVNSTAICDGREVTREVILPEPVVENRPSGPCDISGSTKAKSHLNVYPGESFVYFVNVYNSGGAACTDVTVNDALDSRLTFESCSDGCTVDGRNVTWNLGTVNPGQSLTLRVQVKVNLDATGLLANAALIDTAETPPTTVNVSGPNITTFSELSPGNPARTPDRALARTGGTSTLPLVAALALTAGAIGRHQLRRRTVG